VGERDFTPPDHTPPDTAPPSATLSIDPPDDLLFLARFDGSPVQQIGIGTPTVAGAPGYVEGRFGQAARLASGDRLVYPTAGNLRLSAGTIAFWARLPERYPETSTGRNYLLAASAHPDEDPVYTGTLALRRDLLGPDGAPRWDFWTTPEAGPSARDDLAVPDTLAPGWHHFAITWDRDAGTKALYLDGAQAAEHTGVALPEDAGDLIEIGQFTPGAGASETAIDELAIFSRALAPTEIAQIGGAAQPLWPGTSTVATPEIQLDVNALDDAGGIMSVQLGIDGMFGDPQPYGDGYRLRLPDATGTYTIAARFFDRASNSTTISQTISLIPLDWPHVSVENMIGLAGMLTFQPVDGMSGIELQVSATPDFAGAVWHPLPERLYWTWPSGTRLIWVRFRHPDRQISSPQAVGPDSWRLYLPIVNR
jgi:hypothetical protein